MIIKQMIVGSMSVCCYIIGCEKTKRGAVIDPGGDEDMILAESKKLGLSIDYIINTHGHPDHVCGNETLKLETGASIIMHEEDADFFDKPEVRDYFSMLGLKESPPVDKRVVDKEKISVGELVIEVIHTPGHTPGGICLYCAPHLFTGDTLFVGGVGRTDFPGGDTQAMVKAIKERLLVLPPDTVIWPGHGYGGATSTIEAEAQSNPFLTGTF